jgi:hypothetical protein
MDDSFDAFDPERFRLTPEMAAELARAKAERDADKRKRNKPAWLSEKIAATSKAESGAKSKRDEDWFVQIYVKAVIAGAKAARDRRWAVWIYVHYRVGRENSNTVEVGSKTLRDWGVSPQTKLRALRFYERAGLWSVEWRGGQCPVVTVRSDLCKLRAQ